MPYPTETQYLEHHPLVSFIITAYNIEASLLRSCIESILGLSLNPENREIIVIDDGSETPAITSLLDVCDNLIYVRQRNQGLSVARNRGIDIAQGKFIQFIDGDDSLLQFTYEHCLDIVRFHNPDMVIFDASTKLSVDITEEIAGPFEGTSYMEEHNIRGSVCCYLFKKDILRGLRFRPTLTYYAEDEEFTAQLMLNAKRLFVTPAKSYFYRQHKHSIMHRKGKRDVIQRLENTESVIFYLQSRLQTLPQSKQVALQRRIAQLTMDYLYNTARLTHCLSKLDETCERLHEHGLFPLPNKDYTSKYRLFQKLSKHRWGRRIIIAATLI